MKYLNLFLSAAALLTLGACSSDEGTAGQEAQDIRLLSSLSSTQTRGAFDTDADITRLQGTQIANGETVYAWVEDNNGTASTAYVNAWALTAQGDGTFTGTAQYYPATGHNVDIYCIHGNFASAPTGAFPTAALTHTVALDQSAAADYAKSDLLFGSEQNQPRKTTQPIVFKHKLAKIEVKLKAGFGVTPAQLYDATTTVYIQNTLTSATWTPARDAALAATGDISTYGGAVTASGTAQDIKMYLQKDSSDPTATSYVVFGEAVIVPQDVSPTVNFIKVNIAAGGDLFAKLGGTAAKTFEAGKKYVYTITVNLSNMTLTSTISDWDNGVGDDLNADV